MHQVTPPVPAQLRKSNPKRRHLATAITTTVDSRQLTGCDFDFLKHFPDGLVLERLKEIFQFVKADPAPCDRAIRLPEVLHLLAIGKSSWYERLNPKSPAYDPRAPRPFKLGNSERSPSVWWHSEIIAYLEARAATSRAH